MLFKEKLMKIIEKETTKEANKNNRDSGQELYEKSLRKKKKRLVLVIIAIIVLINIAIFSTVFAFINLNNPGIISGISVYGVNLQGLNREEAIQKLSEQLNPKLERELNITTEEFEMSISPTQIEARFNIEEIVDEVYVIGSNGNIFQNNFEILGVLIRNRNIEPELVYDEQLLENLIEDIAVRLPGTVSNPTYYISEDTLIITRGIAGVTINVEETKTLILTELERNTEENVELNLIMTEPTQINIDEIYNEIFTEAQNAYYTENPFEIFVHAYGMRFDLEEARQLLTEDREEYEIPLIITMPEVTIEMLGDRAFPDLLASYSTRFDPNSIARTVNLQLITDKLDGAVLMPGEVFSVNQTTGRRTSREGYVESTGFAGGRVVPMVGGGICQSSSTLYMAVLYANLGIVERRAHMFVTSYSGPGRDATLVDGVIDFKFENTRSFPILIRTSLRNGINRVEIFGIREEIEKEVEVVTMVLNYIPFTTIYETNSGLASGEERVLQGGATGVNSITYRVLRFNGVEISREVLSRDSYRPMTRIVQRGN